MQLRSADDVWLWRRALSLRDPSGSPWMAQMASGAMECGLRLRFRSYPGVELVTGCSFLMPPVVAGHRRRCPAFTPVILRATRACDIRPTRPPSRRSSRSCESPATVRRGKGGRRREVGMDDWGWQELEPWLIARVALPIGPLFCVINGRTRGRPWTTSGARAEFRRAAARAGVRRRFAPHQLRHAHAVEMAREGVPLIVIQRQLGHSNLGITSVHLQGIDNAEIIETVHPPARADDPGHHLAVELAAPDR
jgi:hypothetical protein